MPLFIYKLQSTMFEFLSNKDDNFRFFEIVSKKKNCTESKDEIKEGYLCDYIKGFWKRRFGAQM